MGIYVGLPILRVTLIRNRWDQKEDWEFQENVLLVEHIAITHSTDETEWVNLMISRQSFTGNTRIETSICLKEAGHGIGILLSVPETSERNTITDGYCLWLGSDQHRSTKLLRSNVEVMLAPDIFLHLELNAGAFIARPIPQALSCSVRLAALQRDMSAERGSH